MESESFLSDQTLRPDPSTGSGGAGARCPDCADKDEDCAEVPDKVRCWIYAPERGMCPYLRSDK